jgi:hypothetical protein
MSSRHTTLSAGSTAILFLALVAAGYFIVAVSQVYLSYASMAPAAAAPAGRPAPVARGR